MVIIGLLAVAAGFVALTVIYWRQTRPNGSENLPADLP